MEKTESSRTFGCLNTNAKLELWDDREIAAGGDCCQRLSKLFRHATWHCYSSPPTSSHLIHSPARVPALLRPSSK